MNIPEGLRRWWHAGELKCLLVWCIRAQTVLICGASSEAFMSDLLREMDHGPAALPAGSSITLFNCSATPDSLALIKQRNRLRNLDVSLVSGNPMDYDELTSKIDVTRCARRLPGKSSFPFVDREYGAEVAPGKS